MANLPQVMKNRKNNLWEDIKMRARVEYPHKPADFGTLNIGIGKQVAFFEGIPPIFSL